MDRELGPQFWIYARWVGVIVGALLLIGGLATFAYDIATDWAGGANIGGGFLVMIGLAILIICIDGLRAAKKRNAKK